jgi:hypothetical protein
MRFLIPASHLFLFLGSFCLSLALDSNVKGELEEDAEFWSRSLMMSMPMSMSMNLGDESYRHNPFPNAGMCRVPCKTDKDCQEKKGIYNPCYWCGKYPGPTYALCYSPDH